MNEGQKKLLIRDMALKAIEDTMPVFERNHELIHIGGGSCREASIARLVAVCAMHELITEKIPEDVAAIAKPIQAELVKFISDKADEERQKLMEEHGLSLKDLLGNKLAEILGVDSFEIHEIDLPKSV